MAKNITLAIPDDLATEMDKFKEVNWSAVARDAIDSYVKRRSNPNLTPILERFAGEKDAFYQKGYNKATEFVATLRYVQLEEVFDAVDQSPIALKRHIKDWDFYHPKIPQSIPKDQPHIYYKGFSDAIMELKEKLTA